MGWDGVPRCEGPSAHKTHFQAGQRCRAYQVVDGLDAAGQRVQQREKKRRHNEIAEIDGNFVLIFLLRVRVFFVWSVDGGVWM